MFLTSTVCFEHLGHILNEQLADDDDVLREIRNMFIRSNIFVVNFPNVPC